MSEEDAFWVLLGLTNTYKRFLCVECKEPYTYAYYTPLISRKMYLKN